MSTSNSSYLDYLFDYARDDWVGLSPVGAVAGEVAGKGATFGQLTSAMLAVIGDLHDRGAVPGDLVEQDPAFRPWSGTKEEHLRRIEAETKAEAASEVTPAESTTEVTPAKSAAGEVMAAKSTSPAKTPAAKRSCGSLGRNQRHRTQRRRSNKSNDNFAQHLILSP